VPPVLGDQAGCGSHRDGWFNARASAPGAERQAQLTGAGGEHLDSEVIALDSTALAAHSLRTGHTVILGQTRHTVARVDYAYSGQ
jgi:hypothetical protein